ncbi:(d)CMP kinase [Risungbinella massiliensis]|uniref:(d)CMP kinase n=1 Tax=Risungbinella massiliensis TaxID=1329796 RepID=UPI0005CBDB27|nr:(d)CMP kinase [Risungbinella massiliensis]
MKRFQVAIDGPAGAGKSTVARQVAKNLGFTFVDSGAMYRAIAWMILQEGGQVSEPKAYQLAQNSHFSLHPQGVIVNGRVLTDELRSPDVSNLASTIATMPRVRQALVVKQQEIAEQESVVMDGRDIGSHVLPNADLKVFLTASIEERAKRRLEDLAQKGLSVDLETLKTEIAARDLNDQTREFSPLIQAEDAYLLDTTQMTIPQVVEKILVLCRTKMGGEE